MRHTEHEYHEAGHRYERAPTPDSARAHAQVIRVMLQAESPDDHAYARHLVEQGRTEARRAPLRARATL